MTLITTVKLIVEIALMALLAQWVLGLIAGPRKDSNLFYQLLQQVGRPFVLLVGWLTPRFVLQRHHPLVAFLMLGFVWALVTVAKISHCLSVGVQLCR